MTKRLIILTGVLLGTILPRSFGQITTTKIILGVNDLWGLHYEGEQFYGLFVNKKLDGDYYEYQIRKINIEDYVPQSASINDYATVNNEKVKGDSLEYVLTGFEPLPKIVKGWKPKPEYKSLYPGES